MTNDRDKLSLLKRVTPPAADAGAKARAMAAAMAAFEAEQEKTEKSHQGSSWRDRLMSIFTKEGHWTMNNSIRIPLGLAAVGLLLFPLTMQLVNTSGLTPVEVPKISAPPSPAPATSEADKVDDLGRALNDEIAPAQEAEIASNAPQPAPTIAANEARRQNLAAAKPKAEAAGLAKSTGMLSAVQNSADAYALPAYQGGGDQFETFTDNGFKAVAQAPVSTFSIDVDTAAYSYVRRALEAGQLPPADAVRTEELVNYFAYDYPAPADASTPFRDTVSVYPTPWNAHTKLMHIGIKGFSPDMAEAPPANIVLLIDTSGSMNEPDKLPLLKRSFALLVNQLGADDKVSIVTYAGSAGVVLEPTPASEKAKILAALDTLTPGGSTAGAAGIATAYDLATKAATDGSNNRVLLATDGDFNVGISDPDQLKHFIEQKRDSGIFLSVLGFGSGNYDDATMQALAQNGNGTAAYIDSYREAQRVLAQEVQSTLTTIAKDVKIQVEFNPATVSEYRLIGYETRALNREDFNNDAVDAGDIGAGHTVTAIYEFTPVGESVTQLDPLRYQTEAPAEEVAGSTDEYAFLKLRYKLPNADTSTLVTAPVRVENAATNIAAEPADVRFATAVAAFAQKLRGNGYADAMSFARIRALAVGARGDDNAGYRAEFVSLVDLAASLSGGEGSRE